MTTINATDVFLAIAAIPFIYYFLALFSSWKFFHRNRPSNEAAAYTPAVSNLKPIRGLDNEAYENFKSYCRQDYPDYELLFAIGDGDEAVVEVIERLKSEFPQRRIRVIHVSGHTAPNDKVVKLKRLVNEAQNEVLVINDSDVRVRPDYLRSVVAPLSNPAVGAVTCMYVSTHEHTFLQKLQSIGMMCDFYPGILVAWQLDGVKFAFGQTIVTTRKNLAGFGGYAALENRPADDLLVGRLVAEQGLRVELLPYAVETVADFRSFGEFFFKRLRWMTVMRHMRPWGHLGLIFTQGLAWSIAAFAIRPTPRVALAYLGGYAAIRIITTWLIGVWGLKQKGIWKKMILVPVWDAWALLIWLLSFGRKSIRWRDMDYRIREGTLVPVARPAAQK
ncbi:MAG TPA: glycosyltransferase [Candidatus Methylomirabilis sp.]|nr:glycosyltransferase [Candidatus Methylomirabilis sp.]